jgi:hypothetical protein
MSTYQIQEATMEMNLQDLGAIGEFVGALLVFISLIYVGLQIRQTGNVIRIESHSAYAGSARELYLAIAEHPHLARLVAEDSGADADWLILRSYWMATIFRFEETWLRYDAGIIDDHAYRHLLHHLDSLAGSPAGRRVWQERPDAFADGFQTLVNQAISRVENSA